MPIDLDHYRDRAQRFVSEIDREYYLHLAGHKPELEIEPIYDRRAELFERDAVLALRELAASANGGDEGRRRRYLLQLAFGGYLGLATKREAEEIAGLEASLEVAGADGAVGYRQVYVEQANEADGERRAALEAARDELLVERLNPLYLTALERSHELTRELGWPSYAAACAELQAIDFEALAQQTARFLRDTDPVYPGITGPRLERAGLPELGQVRRSDLPRFFRAPEFDSLYPQERLVPTFAETMAGLGLELAGQQNVHLDTEQRPTKTPRAFCAPVRVPDEVYLVVAPVGGRDDFGALFHEGGHTEHYANTDGSLPFEFRHLGDNAVTESFAFLLEHLTEEPAWLAARLNVGDPAEALAHGRAVKLYFLRRYAAKIAYELELQGPEPDLSAMPARYAELIGSATRVRWPEAGWISDVDEGFYVACYLRAWALETHWRRALRERFGERWFESADAGVWLRGLWAQGQRLGPDELLAEALGEELDFGVMASEFDPALAL
jgi:hypothetical protein